MLYFYAISLQNVLVLPNFGVQSVGAQSVGAQNFGGQSVEVQSVRRKA